MSALLLNFGSLLVAELNKTFIYEAFCRADTVEGVSQSDFALFLELASLFFLICSLYSNTGNTCFPQNHTYCSSSPSQNSSLKFILMHWWPCNVNIDKLQYFRLRISIIPRRSVEIGRGILFWGCPSLRSSDFLSALFLCN